MIFALLELTHPNYPQPLIVQKDMLLNLQAGIENYTLEGAP